MSATATQATTKTGMPTPETLGAEFRALLSAQNIRASDPSSPRQFATVVKGDRAWWSGVAKAIKLEIS